MGRLLVSIGNQTAFSASSPSEPFHFAVENRFDAFEWFNDKRYGWGWAQEDVPFEDRLSLRETGEQRRIRFSVHARCQANVCEPVDRDEILRSIEFARDIGAMLVNIYYHGDRGVAGFAEALRPVLERAAECGIFVSVENTVFSGPNAFNRLFELLQGLSDIPQGVAGMCFDMGHANLCAATRNNYVGFLEQLEDHVPIIHVHAHENWGDGDSHLPLFTGPAGEDDTGLRRMLLLLKARNYEGSIIFEQWPSPPELLVNARRRLLDLIRQL
ncbi:hypothetical protein JCM19992_09360 [Thermostilla marina]